MKFKILCNEGDTAYDYDVATAELKFNELKSQNLLPMVVIDQGNRALKSFDPDLDEIMWVPAIIGG